MLLLSYGFAALFTVVLPLVGYNLGLPGLIVMMVLIGLWAYAEGPLLQAYLSDNVSASEKDGAFGWYFTLAFGFGSLWGTVLGKIIDSTSFGVAFWVMAGSYVLAAAILLRVPRERPATTL